ncbi:MAG: hypothetical protein JNK72_05625 [Myxococcales bacterium]|nr:hypothetical protein [Myxococcales bacterium]
MSEAPRPRVVLGTPRKLPRADKLEGRVVVLDIAFAAEGTGSSFEKVTAPFLKGLGPRLGRWVDHHDHPYHTQFQGDSRFVLSTKAAHGACPEMVTEALVRDTGPVDVIVCHNDFDGLFSAAKWLRGGVAPYPEADDDARAVDTRLGATSALGARIDRALRSRGRDDAFLLEVVGWLGDGLPPGACAEAVEAAAVRYDLVEAETARVAEARYAVFGGVAVCDVSDVDGRSIDKTELLLIGQRRARVAMVLDTQNVALAAPFDSGIDFLTLLGVGGGMPTRVSVPRGREAGVVEALREAGLYR